MPTNIYNYFILFCPFLFVNKINKSGCTIVLHLLGLCFIFNLTVLFLGHACMICGKRYTKKVSLIQHKKFCGKEARFACDVTFCSYKTNIKSNLNKHLMNHYKKHDVSPLIVKYCNKIG